MSGSLTRGGEENVPGIPDACATRNFTYTSRGPLSETITYGPGVFYWLWNIIEDTIGFLSYSNSVINKETLSALVAMKDVCVEHISSFCRGQLDWCIQQLVRTNSKEIFKAPHHCPFVRWIHWWPAVFYYWRKTFRCHHHACGCLRGQRISDHISKCYIFI